MADGEESLIAKLIPGDLENQVPAAIQKALPGGFKNRLVQAGLGILIAFGLAFVVRKWIEKREAARTLFAPPPPPPAPLPRPFAGNPTPPHRLRSPR